MLREPGIDRRWGMPRPSTSTTRGRMHDAAGRRPAGRHGLRDRPGRWAARRGAFGLRESVDRDRNGQRGHLADNSVWSGEIQDGRVHSRDTNVDSVLRRVMGSCGTNEAVNSITNTGDVTCEFDDFNAIWHSAEYGAESFNGTDAHAIFEDDGQPACHVPRQGIAGSATRARDALRFVRCGIRHRDARRRAIVDTTEMPPMSHPIDRV